MVCLRIEIIIFIAYNIFMKLYSVKEAASQLGLSEPHVRHLVAKGLIKAQKLGHDWVVLELNYQRRRKPKKVQFPILEVERKNSNG